MLGHSIGVRHYPRRSTFDAFGTTMASSSNVPEPSVALMRALRDFVFRREIFVEARECDDDFIFTRLPRRGSRRAGPRRHFEVFRRRKGRRVKFFSLTCGSDDQKRSQVPIDFAEKVLLMPTEAAIEYEDCGRNANR